MLNLRITGEKSFKNFLNKIHHVLYKFSIYFVFDALKLIQSHFLLVTVIHAQVSDVAPGSIVYV